MINPYLYPGAHCQIEVLIKSRHRGFGYAWVDATIERQDPSDPTRWWVRLSNKRVVCRPTQLIRPVVFCDGETSPELVEAERTRLVEGLAAISVRLQTPSGPSSVSFVD